MVSQPTKKKPTPEEIERAKTWATWSKEASTFDWHYDSEETFYVLEGEVTVTWTNQDGTPGEISFGPGDLVTFPEGLSCTWHVKKAIRKHYTFK
ncbi:MAG: cupin domain-containing protein [Promethearchaeota archaeon]